jgi:hypothetical protein
MNSAPLLCDGRRLLAYCELARQGDVGAEAGDGQVLLVRAWLGGAG